jgi:acetyltransferase-like isoleucine patch superfamily enzyme
MSTRIRRYSELRRIDTFEERYKYLALHGRVGEATFGFDRYINQQFYRSTQWRHIRDYVIARDNGCDLGVSEYEIYDRIIIHHMNPMTVDEISHGDDAILEPEFLISTTHRTHNAIHYGDERLLPQPLVKRRPGDTKLW